MSDPVLFEVRSPDSDDDGLTDAEEALLRADPHNPDTDADGLLDGGDPDPLHATWAPNTYLAPIVPPGDAQVLAADSGSSLVERGRQVAGAASFTYRLPLDGIPEGASAVLSLAASGPAALSVSPDGQAFTPAVSAPAGAAEPQALQWAVPDSARAAGVLYLRFAASSEAAQAATLHSVSIRSGVDAPSVMLRGLEPGRPAPGLRNTAVAKAWDPDGLESVTLLYRVGYGAPVARAMEQMGHTQVYTSELPDLANGNVVTIQVKAADKKGRAAVSPAMAFPVGVTRAETISLLGARDFEGELRPWSAAGMDWRWGQAGQADQATATLLGGRYAVWVLAAPRGAELKVAVDGQQAGEAVKRDSPDGWQRLGTVDLKAGKHTFDVVCGPEGPSQAIRGYAQLLLSTDSAAAPRGALITDYFNTISILSPLPGATVGRRLAIQATATGNVVKAECYVDKTLLGTERLAPYEFRSDTRDWQPGEHTIEIRALNGAGEPMLSAQITVNLAR
jgi:hypothetical protein